MREQRVEYVVKQPEKVQTKDLVHDVLYEIYEYMNRFWYRTVYSTIERIDVQNKVNKYHEPQSINDMYLNYSMS